MPLTVPDIISIAKISQYLALNDNQKGNLFGARLIPKSALMLYCERVAVENRYNLNPADPSLPLTSNYLYSICRGYNLQAQNILNNPGAGVISPINQQSAPNPIQFEVDGATPIITGGTTGTFLSFQNFNLLFVRNGVPQTTINQGGGSSYYSWNSATAQLTISPAASAAELFQLYPI